MTSKDCSFKVIREYQILPMVKNWCCPKTYNDLVAVGEDEKARMEFIRSAINAHRGSHAYKTAVDAEEYYNGLNPTINRYEKIVYDMRFEEGDLRIVPVIFSYEDDETVISS